MPNRDDDDLLREHDADAVVSATEFKATCLALMDRVRRTRETILVTKHGKPVARLVPPQDEVPSLWGCMAGTIKIHGDIVGPTTPVYEVSDLPSWPGDDGDDQTR